MPTRPIRKRPSQIGGALLRAPLQLRLGLHDRSQLPVVGEARRPRPACPLPGPRIGKVGVISAVVVRCQVSPQFPAHRGRRPVDPPSDLPHAEPLRPQGGDRLPLQPGQIPVRPTSIGQPHRRNAAVLRPPPIPVFRSIPTCRRASIVPTPDSSNGQYRDSTSSSLTAPSPHHHAP